MCIISQLKGRIANREEENDGRIKYSQINKNLENLLLPDMSFKKY
jgi:hypothetical protein